MKYRFIFGVTLIAISVSSAVAQAPGRPKLENVEPDRGKTLSGGVLNGKATGVTATTVGLGLVNVTSPGGGVGTTLNYLSSSTTLAQAAALTVPAIYTVHTDLTVNTAVTLPRNVTIEYATGGKFTFATGGSLTILGAIEAPRVKLFYGLWTKLNLLLSGPIDIVFPEWFGAVADAGAGGGTDSYAALQLMFDVCKNPNIENVANNGKNGGYTFSFGAGSHYYSSDTLIIRKESTITGGGVQSTSILFAANKTGFFLHGFTTERPAVGGAAQYNADSVSGIFSIFRDIYLRSLGKSGTTHTVNIASNMAITKTAGPDFSGNEGVADGQTFTIGASEWGISGGALAQPVTATTLSLNAHQFQFVVGSRYPFGAAAVSAANDTITYTGNGFLTGHPVVVRLGAGGAVLPAPLLAGTTYYIIKVDANTIKLATTEANASANIAIDLTTAGADGTPTNGSQFNRLEFTGGVFISDRYPVEDWWVGGTIILNGGVYTITAINALASTNAFFITPSIPISQFAPDGYLRGNGALSNVVPRTGVTVHFNSSHGIDSKVPVTVHRVVVRGFAGNGINLDSIGNPNNGSEPNQNNSQLTDIKVYGNLGSGLYTRGTNANNMVITGIDSQANHWAGVWDVSSLGNNYFGGHTSNNYFTGYYTQYLSTNRSVFVGCYSEADQPPNSIGSHGLWVGGNPGNGFVANNAGSVMLVDGSTGDLVLSQIRVDGILNLQTARFAPGSAGRPLGQTIERGKLWYTPSYTTGTPDDFSMVIKANDETYTWKRFAFRRNGYISLTDAATVVINADLSDYFSLTSSFSRTIGVPTNPADGQPMNIRFKNSAATAQTLTLTTGSADSFAFTDVVTTLTATPAGKVDIIQAVYDFLARRWLVTGYVKLQA